MRIKSYKSFINEGLIRSVDIDLVRKNLIRKEGIIPDNITIYNQYDDIDKIGIWFNFKNHHKIKRVHNKMKVFGWFLSSISTTDPSQPTWENEWVNDIDIDELMIMFKDEYRDDELSFNYERKFEKEVDTKYDKLYHATSLDNIERIKKYGLVPRSGNKKSIHPDRIYLVHDIKDFDDTDLFEYLDRPVILEIDNHDDPIKLHHDINMKGGLYTTDNISPDRIKFP